MSLPHPTPIPLAEPSIGAAERALVDQVLASGWVSSVGPYVERFERDFAAYVGSPHAVACASGTSAIHLALIASGVTPNDIVFVSDFTFIASANPIRHCGAQVAVIGSEAASWNMDPAALADALADAARTKRMPKAVIVVHILGNAADLGPLYDLCDRYGVTVIEDAAESLGARYTSTYAHSQCRGKQVGSIGRLGCFSFNGNKLLTCGGGGMVTTADEALAKQIKHLSQQAKMPGLAYAHDAVGYNYRLTNLAAGVGLAQLGRLAELLKAKREIHQRYFHALQTIGWSMQPVLPHSLSSFWLPSVLVGPRRDAVQQSLSHQGIATRPLWLPIHAQIPYKGVKRWGNDLAHTLSAQGLSLPCSVHLSQADQQRVINALSAAHKEFA